MLIGMNITATHGASPCSRKRNERSCRKGFLYVDDILVCGTTEKQRGVFELFHKFSVYQYVDMRKQCAERFGIANLAGEQIIFKGKARIAPNGFLRKSFLDGLDKMEKPLLMLGLHRLAAEKRKPRDILVIERGNDFFHGFFGEGRAVIKAPLLGIEAALAVVTASADEKRNAHTDTVCNIEFFDGCVIHRYRPKSKMKHTLFDLLCSALIPELCTDITAGASCDVHLALIAVSAVRTFPNELVVFVASDLNFTVVSADRQKSLLVFSSAYMMLS